MLHCCTFFCLSPAPNAFYLARMFGLFTPQQVKWTQCLFALLFSTTFSIHAARTTQPRIEPPAPPREFRGVWVASVANIDWPSRPGLPVAQQQAELEAIIDQAASIKLNAIILQVRPACDALYASSIEPWSEYLTGRMGKAPEPFYDPLEFAINKAHARGLELHAWFNPFRARHPSAKSPPSPNHVSQTRPALVKTYGKHLWLDPGEKAVQDYSIKVILDVVRRYDVDGVHIDDYFYPYKEKDEEGKVLDFPDETSWQKYQKSGGKLSRTDWRRENVNRFIERLFNAVKSEKSWVKVGVSPFGIWRPGFPAGIKGYDPYENLYADSRYWLQRGWMDYFVPQLYWSLGAKEQSFSRLLEWWVEQNTKQVLLCPGINSRNVGTTWESTEIIKQIQTTRRQPGTSGHVHWSIKALQKTALADALGRELYANCALPPVCPNQKKSGPPKPKAYLGGNASTGGINIIWESSSKTTLKGWVVQAKSGSSWFTEVLPRDRASISFRTPAPDVVAISALDRWGNIGTPAVLQPQPGR